MSIDTGKVNWITTPKLLKSFFKLTEKASEVVFDLETTGLHEHAVTGGLVNGGVAARVSMLSVTLPIEGSEDTPETYLIPLSHPDSPFLGSWRTVLKLWAEKLNEVGSRLVAHNAKFDLKWVYATTGVDISKLFHWDTQVVAALLDENNSTRLKEVVPRLFGVESWADVDLSYPGASEDADYWHLGEYAGLDTFWTWYLYRYQTNIMTFSPEEFPETQEDFENAKLGAIAEKITKPTIQTLAQIEQRGFLLDKDWVEVNLTEALQEADSAMAELIDKYDMPESGASTSSNSKWFLALVEKALEKDDLRVISMTAKGNFKWGKDELNKLALRGSRTAELILIQRDGTKRSQFLKSWLEKVTPNQTIHSNYNVGKTATGRLSSSDPNLQQVSRRLRQAFKPRPGYVLVDADYSQLELRIAAYVANSKTMRQAFFDDIDVHSLLASEINKISPKEVTKDQRQAGKAGNFGFLYGQEPRGFRDYAENSYGVVLTEQESVEMHSAFFSRWEGMREWHDRTYAQIAREGQVTSPIGRVRRLHDYQSGGEWGLREATRKGLNAPVQGLGADIMNLGMSSIAGNFKGHRAVSGAFALGTVHDSAMFEVEENNWEEISNEIKFRLENVSAQLKEFYVEFDVPLKVDIDVGTRWGISDIYSS